ncbi:MAG: amino acid ABC transporter permease [Ornithinimicrobium sp.]|uniref:amino acid ABC transporter permease n=1 Tax=Ornithinimicrobium sp. TaxID=1977084 RepID=UPI0026E03742|nr:amino acid ABC transporter permease [Ornithinimicrobium sp.]MDO5738803.1 amino acid ABC transporter permease [Ornithinimicrobium sp.]
MSASAPAGTGERRVADPVAIPVRHYGRWVGAVVVLVLLAGLVWAFSRGNIDYGVTVDYVTNKRILHGMWNTLLISVLAQLVGIVLGVVAAVMRKSANPVTSFVAWLYIWFFRGTPVLVQLLVWYNLSLVFPTIGLPGLVSFDTNTLMTPFLAALLGLGINEGAYMAEIVRAGINSVDEGQTEAAKALGMSPSGTMRRVVLPQAMRVIIPPTGNEFINMLKTSSLAYAVQFSELLLSAVGIYSNNLMVIELLFTVSIWYLVLTSVFSVGQYFLEQRFARGHRRDAPVGGPLRRILTNLAPGRTR